MAWQRLVHSLGVVRCYFFLVFWVCAKHTICTVNLHELLSPTEPISSFSDLKCRA